MLGEGYDYGAIVIDHRRRRARGPKRRCTAGAMVRAMGTASRAKADVPGAVACVNPESMPRDHAPDGAGEGLLPLQGLHDAFEVLGRMADYAMFQAAR